MPYRHFIFFFSARSRTPWLVCRWRCRYVAFITTCQHSYSSVWSCSVSYAVRRWSPADAVMRTHINQCVRVGIRVWSISTPLLQFHLLRLVHGKDFKKKNCDFNIIYGWSSYYYNISDQHLETQKEEMFKIARDSHQHQLSTLCFPKTSRGNWFSCLRKLVKLRTSYTLPALDQWPYVSQFLLP